MTQEANTSINIHFKIEVFIFSPPELFLSEPLFSIYRHGRCTGPAKTSDETPRGHELDFRRAFRSPILVTNERCTKQFSSYSLVCAIVCIHGKRAAFSFFARLLSPLLLLCLFSSCELPPPVENSDTAFSNEPRVIHPPHEAAVLLLEDNSRFIDRLHLAGGTKTYQNAVENLARILGDHGVETTVLSIEDGDSTLRKLANYHAIFLVDSLAIYKNLQSQLEAYVRSGGVLVGIGEVGRYNGEWEKSWPFGRLFGLKPKVTDPWETSISRENSGMYQYAKRFNEDRLLEGIKGDIDWGTNASLTWVTQAQAAKVVATFPQYTIQFSKNEKPRTIDLPFPALTIHHLDRGVAIFCSVLPSGRNIDGWKNTSDTGRVLANALKYSADTLVLPAIKPTITIGRNQVAYDPEWPKHIILRIESPPISRITSGTYVLKDSQERTVRQGPLHAWSKDRLWNASYVDLDFSDITQPDEYRLHVDLPRMGSRILTRFRIDESLIEKDLLPSQLHFFRHMRCGEKCHIKDPVTGGYHDATGDWAVRMWSMPHVVWALARYLEKHPHQEQVKEELNWALDWCLQMQAPDGSVYASIHPPDDVSPINIRPWQDKMVREIEKNGSFEYTATYCAAMARASFVLGQQQDPHSKQILSAAQAAFRAIRNKNPQNTKDIGNRIWAATELYRVSADISLLLQARKDLPNLLHRQLTRGKVLDGDIYGDFFADKENTSFSPQQWKVFHSIGIYMGLIEMRRLLDEESVVRKNIEGALERFIEGYLLPMSALSPYGQMAAALEQTQKGAFKVYQFSHPDAWIHDHGLHCDMLAMATIALELSEDFENPQLRMMAARQINWILGDNPLGYCMVTGLGQKHAPLIDSHTGTGHIKGGIPNGIIGRGRNNLPVWGASWDSREYWLPQNAYLISTLGLLEEE